MTVAGDELSRRHAASVIARVGAVRRGVEAVMLDSGLPSSGRVDRVAEQLTEPLLAASWSATSDQLDYAWAYAALEGAPPPSMPTGPVSQETREGIAGLALVMRAAIARGRRRGQSARAIAETLAVVTGGQASRAVMHDSRSWAERYLTRDPSVYAYRRVPDEDPCHWCAMLASRGFVYRTQRSAGDVRVVQGWHPACACTTQAWFRGKVQPTLDRVTVQAQDIYDESTRGHRGKDKARAFRRAWDDRRQ